MATSDQKNLTAVQSLVRLLRQVGGGPRLMVSSFTFSTTTALLEGASMALTVPLLDVLFRSREILGEASIPVVGFLKLPVLELARHSRSALLAYLMGLLFLSASLKTIFEFVNRLSIDRQIQVFVKRLRQSMFSRFLTFGKAYFDRSASGQVYNVMLNNTQMLSGGLTELRSLLTTALLTAIYTAILLTISWKLTLIGAVLYPLYHGLAQYVFRKLQHTSNVYSQSISELSQAVAEVLGSIPLILSYGTQAQEKKRFSEISEKVRMLDTSMTRKQAFAIGAQEFFMTTLMIGLALVAYLVLVRPDGTSGSQFLVYFLVLRRLSASLSALLGMKLAFERIGGSLRMLATIYGDDDKCYVIEGSTPFSGLQSAIEFKDTVFAYEAGKQVLGGVSFKIKKGQFTAIVGPSGSGKTTIMGLLQRLYDCPPNSIFVDGVDIRNLKVDSLRSRVAVVSQDVYLFNTTLRENLCYGLAREISESELNEIIGRSALADMVHKLPQGIHTPIGDRGVKLSGGEKQRVSIARALIKQSEILLLDEATSALDTETERAIQAALTDLVKSRTVIAVAHRLSTVMHADWVIVLERGLVVEQGNVQDLLAKRGRFHRYYTLQSFESTGPRVLLPTG